MGDYLIAYGFEKYIRSIVDCSEQLDTTSCGLLALETIRNLMIDHPNWSNKKGDVKEVMQIRYLWARQLQRELGVHTRVNISQPTHFLRSTFVPRTSRADTEAGRDAVTPRDDTNLFSSVEIVRQRTVSGSSHGSRMSIDPEPQNPSTNIQQPRSPFRVPSIRNESGSPTPLTTGMQNPNRRLGNKKKIPVYPDWVTVYPDSPPNTSVPLTSMPGFVDWGRAFTTKPRITRPHCPVPDHLDTPLTKSVRSANASKPQKK